jgi:hypothetical protein
MKRISHLFVTTVAGALLLVGGACSSSPGSTTGTGGSGGSSNGPPAGYIPLTVSATGFVQVPAANIVGPWYVTADSVGPNANTSGDDAANSDCESASKGGFPAASCSQINNPKPGQPFAPTDATTSKMCTDGTAAVVLQKGSSYDYTDMWGAEIGVDFNNPGGDAGMKSTVDLSAYKGIYFEISGSNIPANAMRVNFPFTGQHNTDAPYWQGATMMFSPIPTTGGKFEAYWSSCPTAKANDANCTIGGPYYLSQQNPPTDFTKYLFDPKVAESVTFQVTTNQNSATPFNFCVSNLALIPK